MIGAVLAYFRGAAAQLMAGVLFAALVGYGIQTWRVHSLNADLVAVTAERDAAKETAKLSEGLRGQEQAQDKASFGDVSERCEQRVDNARQSGAIIKEVVNVPAFAQAPSYSPADPVRALVPAAKLRGIIGQAAPAQAAGLPIGSNKPATR